MIQKNVKVLLFSILAAAAHDVMPGTVGSSMTAPLLEVVIDEEAEAARILETKTKVINGLKRTLVPQARAQRGRSLEARHIAMAITNPHTEMLEMLRQQVGALTSATRRVPSSTGGAGAGVSTASAMMEDSSAKTSRAPYPVREVYRPSFDRYPECSDKNLFEHLQRFPGDAEVEEALYLRHVDQMATLSDANIKVRLRNPNDFCARFEFARRKKIRQAREKSALEERLLAGFAAGDDDALSTTLVSAGRASGDTDTLRGVSEVRAAIQTAGSIYALGGKATERKAVKAGRQVVQALSSRPRSYSA